MEYARLSVKKMYSVPHQVLIIMYSDTLHRMKQQILRANLFKMCSLNLPYEEFSTACCA